MRPRAGLRTSLQTSRRAFFGTLAAGLTTIPAAIAASPALAESVYSAGGWATLHRSGDNRRFAGEVPIHDRYRTWHALAGASVLTAPTLSPDAEMLYVTTGRSAGNANLHAFAIDGSMPGRASWSAPAWVAPGPGIEATSDSGLDPCAILSSPIVDREGDLYIGDCNQLFAFHRDGSPKWSRPLPDVQPGDWQPSPSLPINALTTTIFTAQGDLAGVTNFGDVVVVDRATGRSVAKPFRLPGRLPPPSSVPMPDSVFGNGLMDPEIRDWAWQLLFGGRMRSANTPAVDVETGRIFVAATSTREGLGALYALDLVPTGDDRWAVEIAYATDMGPGSGSSPALSPAGDRVYVSDEDGVLYAIDALDGAILWTVQTQATAAAAAVGKDGVVYCLQAHGPALIAVAPDGRIQWQSDLSRLTRARLPSSWLLGDPVALGNGNPTVLEDHVLLPVIYGYETRIGRRTPWPVHSVIVAVDRRTGEGTRDVVTLADDSTGITVALADGTLISSLGTALTSGVTPLAALSRWLLPDGLRLLAPVGGIQVSRPER